MADEEKTKPTASAETTATTATTATEAPPPHRSDEPRKPPEEEISFGKYLWNGEKNELLGRTFCSWILITIFYLIFFFCLFVFFVMCWFVSLAVLNPRAPYRLLDDGILGRAGPGFTVRPSADRVQNAETTLIWFKPGAYDNYKFWSEQLDNWFSNIPKKGRKNTKDCIQPVKLDGSSKSLLKENSTAKEDDVSCLVDPTWYGPCSLDADPTFGYDRGEPCLLLKLNRIYNWEPKPFTYEEWASGSLKVPKSLSDYVKGLANPAAKSRKKRQEPEPAPAPNPEFNKTGAPGEGSESSMALLLISPEEAKKEIGKYLFVWCEGEFDYDKEALGSFQYYPGPFIPTAFFPFKGQINYQSPFIMLQLKRPMPGAMISIVCQIYAKNIKNDRETGVGYTRFQIMAG